MEDERESGASIAGGPNRECGSFKKIEPRSSRLPYPGNPFKFMISNSRGCRNEMHVRALKVCQWDETSIRKTCQLRG